jgi:flagellar biosynthesis protein FlhG
MAVSIAVTSGKGGVGKTNSAVNMALALGKAGQRVLLFDADFGLANTHIMLGCNPTKTVADFLNGTASLEDTITDVGENVQLIAGGSGLVELLKIDDTARYRIVTALSNLQDKIDYMIVDCPAGASDSTLFFANAANIVLVVLVAEPTSFLDAYALVKAAHLEKGVTDFSVLVNMADSARTAEINFSKFRDIAMRFLDLKLHYAGSIPQSTAIRRSIVQRKPICAGETDTALAKTFGSIAKDLTTAPHSRHDAIKFF